MPTVTKIVGRLRDDGLVTTASSERDARVTVVMLTDAGKQKVAEAMPLVGKIFDKGFKGMSANQVEKMNQSLSKVPITSMNYEATRHNDKIVTCVDFNLNSL